MACGLRICALVVWATLVASPAASQTAGSTEEFPHATGADRGSTALVEEVEETTYFLTYDTYGAASIGPSVAAAAGAFRPATDPDQQLDAVALAAGPSEDGRAELAAVGLGYRVWPWEDGPGFFVRGDYAKIRLGTGDDLALDLRGEQWNAAAGLFQEIELSGSSRLTGTLEFEVRDRLGFMLDAPVLDEELRIVHLGASYRTGVPFGRKAWMSAKLSKGIPGLGGNEPDIPLASRPGARGDFFRVSGSAGGSLPVAGPLVLSAAAVGQWTDDPLPFSQRCGYGTNAFSRGFDRAFVNADKCIGARNEIAAFLPSATLTEGLVKLSQLYAAVDYGVLWDVATEASPASRSEWSSLSGGIRFATSNLVGELAITHILEEPPGIIDQQDTRFWVRFARRF